MLHPNWRMAPWKAMVDGLHAKLSQNPHSYLHGREARSTFEAKLQNFTTACHSIIRSMVPLNDQSFKLVLLWNSQLQVLKTKVKTLTKRG